LPSVQKLSERARDLAIHPILEHVCNLAARTGAIPPDIDISPLAAQNSNDLHKAIGVALVVAPILEVIQVVLTRFENSIFGAIAGKVDQVFALPASFLPALPAPSKSPAAADPGPPGSAKIDSRGTGRSSEATGIDFDALAETLLRNGQALPSELVKFMKDRTIATFQDVMDQVHGGERNEGTVRTLCNRTNNALHGLESRLRFSTKNCQVIRHVDRE